MGYQLKNSEADALLARLSAEYDIYAPKRFLNQGRYSDTDLVQYDKISRFSDIEYAEKSNYSAKEVLAPITQAIFYFTEEEYRESAAPKKKMLIFLRPCDIHAFLRQDAIYLENGAEDFFYKRVRDNVRFVMMECREGFDNCFCVSMGTNATEKYSLAVRFGADGLTVDVKDSEFDTYFTDCAKVDFTPEYVQENILNVTVPEAVSADALNALKKHTVWNEYNQRCISCGGCTSACPTCTCFNTIDKIYTENAHVGERRRVVTSCQFASFDTMAGQKPLRKNAAERARYRVLHKVLHFRQRFGFDMCVGCGRCSTNCPKLISFPATIGKMVKALEEIAANSTDGRGRDDK